jgi:hypothetical protein
VTIERLILIFFSSIILILLPLVSLFLNILLNNTDGMPFFILQFLSVIGERFSSIGEQLSPIDYPHSLTYRNLSSHLGRFFQMDAFSVHLKIFLFHMNEAFVQVNNVFIQMNQLFVQMKNIFIHVDQVLVQVKNNFIQMDKMFVQVYEAIVRMKNGFGRIDEPMFKVRSSKL